MSLTEKTCEPCEGGIPPLSTENVEVLLEEVDGWSLNSDNWLIKEYTFDDFARAFAFVERVADLAESEGHHPNVYLHSWNRLRLELYTHAIDGLSENDFILAAKINELEQKRETQ